MNNLNFIEVPATNEILTFDEANLQGGRIAQSIINRGFSKFILACDKTLFHYMAVIGAWNSGIPFCPIDITGPIEKITSIMEILSDYAILCSKKTREYVPELYCNRCIIVEDTFTLSPYNGKLMDSKICYIIATSGTTGVPKLVSVNRISVIKFFEWAIPYYRMNSETRWAQFSPITFDLSLIDIYGCYFAKSTLVPAIAHNERILPYRFIQNNNITHWHSVPSVIRFITGDHLAEVVERQITFSFCGEPLLKEWVARLKSIFPNSKVINTYGPTEGTFFCSYFNTDEISHDAVFSSYPIGTSIPGWEFIFKSSADNDGYELLIASDFISNGYINCVSDDFGTMRLNNKKTLLFRTRDVFQIDNGYTFFEKRIDKQIKLYGNRIDLGEIENACLNVGIKNPVAIVDHDHVIVFSEGGECIIKYDELKQLLTGKLPSYAIPSTCISMDYFPLTSSGKIDKEKLKGFLHNE